MRRLVDVLAPAGLVVIAVAALASRQAHPLPGKLELWVLGGLTLILAHALLRYEDILSAVGARQLRYGGNAFALSLIVAGILGAGNYLVVRHDARWDLTKNQRYSLSDQSKKVVQGLKEDVKISFFAKGGEAQSGQERLKQYQAVSPHIKVEFIDPVKDPMKARSYGVTAVPTLVVERGTRQEKITSDGEQDLTNAVIKVTRDAKKSVCFAVGEGEHDPEDSGDKGYSSAKSALAKSQYDVQNVVLLRERTVPAACTVLVVSGPEKDLLAPAIDAIRDFVKKGGKALVMVEPEFKESYSNLTGLLKEWNIETAKDVVVDISGVGQLFGTGPLTPIATQYPYHEITKDFRVMTAFHTARSMEPGKGTVEGVTTQSLLQTSQASWAETDLSLKEPVEMNEGKDRQGPISLGVVATLRGPEPKPSPPPAASPSPSPSPAAEEAKPKPPEGRVVAFGDSDFASNAMLGFQGNRDFFLNTVAWLAEDPDLISIRPKEPDDQRMFLTGNQVQNVFFLAIVILPGFFVVLGVWAWWRRR